MIQYKSCHRCYTPRLTEALSGSSIDIIVQVLKLLRFSISLTDYLGVITHVSSTESNNLQSTYIDYIIAKRLNFSGKNAGSRRILAEGIFDTDAPATPELMHVGPVRRS